MLLLKLVDSADVDALVRVAASIAFKNSVKRNWKRVSEISMACRLVV